MSTNRQIQNLSLIGFMGTGKSSVGRILADQLGFSFLDTDELIEQRAGKSISDIFQQDGEVAFRALERQVVEDLASRSKTVISTGGGLAANADNLASLKTHSLTICLWASLNTIFERVRHQSHRPLLQCSDPKAKIRELLAQREPFYRQADVLINTEVRSIKDVAHQILHQFHIAKNRR